MSGATPRRGLVARLTRRADEVPGEPDDLAAMLAIARLGLARVAPDGRFLWVNDGMAELLGRSRDELLATGFQPLTHPDDLAADIANVEALLRGERTYYAMEKRYLRPDGSVLEALLTVSLQRDARGAPQWFVSAIQDIGALKAGQRALAAAEQRLVAALRSLPEPIAIRDRGGRYVLVNPALEHALGRPAAQILGRDPVAVFGPELGAQVRAGDRAALEARSAVQADRWVGDGALRRHYRVRVVPLFDAAGHPEGVLSVAHDLTEREHHEAAMASAVAERQQLLDDAAAQRLALLSALEDAQSTRERLQAVLTALPDLCFLFDAEGRFIDLWAADARRLLVPREQALGQRFDELVPAAVAARGHTALQRVLGGSPLETFSYALDVGGQRKRFEMRMTPAGSGLVLGIARDISAEHAAQQVLARREEILRLALEASGDGSWDRDLSQDRAEFSEGFARLLRYSGPGFRDAFRFRERLHPEDRAAAMAAMERTLREGVPFACSFRLRCFDDEYRWFSARGGVQRGADGRPLHFSGVLSDLGARLQAEERLRLAQAVFEHTQEGIVISDAQRRIVAVNPALLHALGWPGDAVVGHEPREFIDLDGDALRAMQAGLDAQGRWQGEMPLKARDGTRRPHWVSISVVRDPAGTVTHQVAVCRDISELKRSEERLEFLAHHDPLTQLPNRLLLMERLEQALAQARREGSRVALLLVDLDHFKDVNDSWGHAAGDALLRHVATALAARLRRSDTLARLGGDEFALLMAGPHEPADAARLATELLQALAAPWRGEDGLELQIGASIGIAIHPEHGDDAAALLAHADAAMYRAKADGRGTTRFYADEMTAAALERLRLEARLKRALALGHFVLHWQPQLDVASGRVVGAEALLRWADPDEGLIAPGRFIATAEACGLIGPLGAWVLQEACRTGARWRAAGLPPLVLTVNVSARQFALGDLDREVGLALDAAGWPAGQLELEITESALMSHEDVALAMLGALRRRGVRVSIDDFGTGYSSLAVLKRYPLDQLKIDRSFVTGVPDDADDAAITSAVIAVGRALGLTVLAEGVETAAQLDWLVGRGCDRWQGYLASRPLPADDFVAWWRARGAG